jgi:hypothetical protein
MAPDGYFKLATLASSIAALKIVDRKKDMICEWLHRSPECEIEDVVA